MTEPNTSTRRSFYGALINLLGAAMAGVIAVPAAAYLLLKPKGSDADNMVEIADLGKLEVGKPQEVVYQRVRTDGWKTVKEKTTAWVVKTGPQQAVAYSPQCTHLACAYHWEDTEKHFVCPCHASVFAVDGKVVGGPAPRPLDRFESKVEGGKLLIGSSTTQEA